MAQLYLLGSSKNNDTIEKDLYFSKIVYKMAEEQNLFNETRKMEVLKIVINS